MKVHRFKHDHLKMRLPHRYHSWSIDEITTQVHFVAPNIQQGFQARLHKLEYQDSRRSSTLYKLVEMTIFSP